MSESVRAIATHYRRFIPANAGGIVLIWRGQAYGWKDALRDPQSERPGVYAVDDDQQVYIAKGGNDYDGAQRWEAVKDV